MACRQCGNCCIDVGQTWWKNGDYENIPILNRRKKHGDYEDGGLPCEMLRFRNGLAMCQIQEWFGYEAKPEVCRDHDGDEIRGRYTYYFNPKISTFVEYRYWHRDFESESFFFFDYEVHNPTLGFTWDLYQNVTLSASGGYSVRDAEDRKNEEAFSGRGTFSAKYKRLTLDLYGETGFGEDFLSSESLGFNEFWRAGVNGRYQLLQRLWLAAFFYIIEEDFTDRLRKQTLWSARGTVNYQILRWLFLSTEYEHNERDSNIPLESYKDNRYFGRITVQYDIAERFQ